MPNRRNRSFATRSMSPLTISLLALVYSALATSSQAKPLSELILDHHHHHHHQHNHNHNNHQHPTQPQHEPPTEKSGLDASGTNSILAVPLRATSSTSQQAIDMQITNRAIASNQPMSSTTNHLEISCPPEQPYLCLSDEHPGGKCISVQSLCKTQTPRRLFKRSGISDQRLAEIQMVRALKRQLEKASKLSSEEATATTDTNP